ncbi:MAG TPA: class I SAM-dependent methyltransferase [Gemmataceae bacterium]|nr:class I SAM-dependent methyltransferase [Gemmataceae bacterium]
MHIETAVEISGAIKGWLTPSEMRALYTLAFDTSATSAIVELGAWQGKSTIMLAAGSSAGQNAPVFSVDYFNTIPNTGYAYGAHLSASQDYLENYRQNVEQVRFSAKITPVRSNTEVAGKTWEGLPVGLLFIDADHRYESVRCDFLAWAPRCVEGAWVAFHDYGQPEHSGVGKFVDQLLAAKIVTNACRADSLLYANMAVRDPLLTRRLLGRYPCWYCWLQNRLKSKCEQTTRLWRRIKAGK